MISSQLQFYKSISTIQLIVVEVTYEGRHCMNLCICPQAQTHPPPHSQFCLRNIYSSLRMKLVCHEKTSCSLQKGKGEEHNKDRYPCKACWCSVFKLPYKVLYQYIYPRTKKLNPDFDEHRKVNLSEPKGMGIALDRLYDRKQSCPCLLAHGNVEADLQLCLLSSFS